METAVFILNNIKQKIEKGKDGYLQLGLPLVAGNFCNLYILNLILLEALLPKKSMDMN